MPLADGNAADALRTAKARAAAAAAAAGSALADKGLPDASRWRGVMEMGVTNPAAVGLMALAGDTHADAVTAAAAATTTESSLDKNECTDRTDPVRPRPVLGGGTGGALGAKPTAECTDDADNMDCRGGGDRNGVGTAASDGTSTRKLLLDTALRLRTGAAAVGGDGDGDDGGGGDGDTDARLAPTATVGAVTEGAAAAGETDDSGDDGVRAEPTDADITATRGMDGEDGDKEDGSAGGPSHKLGSRGMLSSRASTSLIACSVLGSPMAVARVPAITLPSSSIVRSMSPARATVNDSKKARVWDTDICASGPGVLDDRMRSTAARRALRLTWKNCTNASQKWCPTDSRSAREGVQRRRKRSQQKQGTHKPRDTRRTAGGEVPVADAAKRGFHGKRVQHAKLVHKPRTV